MGTQRGKAKDQSPSCPGDICLYSISLRGKKSEFIS